MKKIIIRTLIVFLMLISTVQAFAYDFELDGICYNITSDKDRTAEVTFYSKNFDNRNFYKGVVSIPKKIIHSSKTYTVTSIGDNAFEYCSGLTSIDIPNSVTSIGDFVFEFCSGLTSVDIPNSVTSIGEGAFSRCFDLTSIDIPNSVTSIDYFAFNSCSGLTSIDIPNSVTSIGEFAFKDCIDLTSVKIPNSVTSIGECVFEGCNALMKINVAEDNEKFSSMDGVLYNKDASKLISYPEGNSAISSVTLPSTLTSIAYGVFDNLKNITTIYLQGETPPAYDSVFPDNMLKNTVLYVPKGSLGEYEKVAPWRDFWNIEELDYSGIADIEIDGVESITVDNGDILIDGYGGAEVNVYDISGRLVYCGHDSLIRGLTHGVYIVQVGTEIKKISL